ncbi:MAG: alpha/beta hydrolase [Alphaproteobacteria bacterium]|nr:alpha/beta hydrolase [Alphaproteobacteria bacterium]
MAAPEPRQGPRPAGLHILTAAASWNASLAALPLLKAGSLNWRAPLQPEGAALVKELEGLDTKAFNRAIARVAGERLATLHGAIESYRRHPYRRDLVEPPAVWQDGTTRLLDYGAVDRRAAKGVPVLAIPSLINRYYVLDLSAKRSLARYLAGRGVRLFMVDWAAPGASERNFTLSDYIVHRLEPALRAAQAISRRPVGVLGYCMGGLLAAALAVGHSGEVPALALLATPWDFHAVQPERARAAAALFRLLRPAFASAEEMPVDAIQTAFHALDPWRVVAKFMAFAALDPASEQAAAFVALEDWVNDGVPLGLPVAEACMVDWYGANSPARGEWQVAGRPVRPAEFRGRSYVLAPALDHIVPPESALPLGLALPQARSRLVESGHIGMVIGRNAPRRVWAPLAAWLLATVAKSPRARRPSL